jgi:hypothetical protein
VTDNWRAEYARRFNRVAIERPALSRDLTDDEIATIPFEWQRSMALMCRQMRQSIAQAMGVPK